MDGWVCGLCEWVKDLKCAITVVVTTLTVQYESRLKTLYHTHYISQPAAAVQWTVLFFFFVLERPRIAISTENDSP